MGKNLKQYVRRLILILLTIITGLYTFTQALQVPLTEIAAEKVLAAWYILQHIEPLSTWSFHPLELPVYLLFVKVIGLGTFTSIAVNVFFYLILFCTGLLIMKSRGLLNIPNILIWTALTGLPDPNWLSTIQSAPFLILGLILTPHFLSDFFSRRKRQSAIFASTSFILTSFSLPKPFTHPAQPHAVHETLRALQSVFRADFSQQPIMHFTTGRYFLMTIVLLLMIWGLIRTVRQFTEHQHQHTAQYLYALFMIITLLWCCFPFSGDRNQKMSLCAWLPYGTAFLLIFIIEDPAFRDLHLARGRLPLSTLAGIFSLLTILFSIGPIVRSRPVSPADRVILYLNEHNQLQGACSQNDLALLSVAAKGRISFSTDPDAPGNTFTILRTSSETDQAAKFEKIPPFLIMIHQ